MLDSVRTKLTLQYAGVLALVLVAFSLIVYALLARNLSLRFDEGLRLTIDSMALTLARDINEVREEAEREEEEKEEGKKESEEEVAEGVIEDIYFPSQSIAILDGEGKILAQRVDDKKSPPPVTENFAASDQIAFYTIERNAESHRAAVRRIRVGDKPYTLLASQSRASLVKELASFRDIFYIAAPTTLLLTALGGWLLARKSLAPVVAMSERARRIGAENLEQRLPVVNPRDELGRLARTFNELLARVADAFAQQRQFMADASHELRTPLYVIRTAAEVTLEQPLRDEGEYREALSIIREQTRRLTRIVEDMFMLARADAERRDMEQKDFYLDELLLETARAASLLASHKNVRVETHLTSEVAYRGDENLLRQMILNLFDNAIKYTPSGGEVSVTLTRNDSACEITVADTGIGIPVEAQAHIFERFYRVDKSRSRAETESGGAGLGLSIARWIAESHEGRLELRHSDGQGSLFVVTLPINSAR